MNISPSLQTPSPLDMAVKGPLIRDVLNAACFQIPSKIPGYSIDKLTKSNINELEIIFFKSNLIF